MYEEEGSQQEITDASQHDNGVASAGNSNMILTTYPYILSENCDFRAWRRYQAAQQP